MARRISDKAIIKALELCAGKTTLAAKKLGCHWDTIYERAKRVPAVRRVMDQAREELLDVAEIALKQAVLQGEGWAVCFALKCQGKGRGYIEQQRVEHSGRIEGDAANVVVVKIEQDWYSNANRFTPEAFAPAASSAVIAGPAQTCSLRPALGEDRDGPDGDDNGARSRARGNGRSN